MITSGPLLEVGHLPIRCSVNDLRVGLKDIDTEKPVVIRRLIFGGYAEPFVVWIEHQAITSRRQMRLWFRLRWIEVL